MSTDDLSGPAFPCPEAGQSHFGQSDAYMGLTVRELIAAQFAAAILANPSHHGFLHAHDERNKIAFQAADSWLKARSA